MKFIVSSTSLLSHLQAISRVINAKNSMPILECVLFKLEGNSLTMTATDVDTTMTTTIDVIEAEGSGLFAVSAKMLIDPLKKLPDQPLTIEINNLNYEIFIYFQNGKYNFIGANGDEYPQLASMSENTQMFSIPSTILLSGINHTLFAAADDELRPIMNGILMDVKPDDINFVASDTHKLVRMRNTAIHSGIEVSFILPKKPAALLKNVLPKENGMVSVSIDEKNACFKLNNFIINCRLIEGRYPNYNSVIPQNNTNTITIDRQLLANVLERVSVFSSQSTNLIKLELSTDQIRVSTQDVDYSTAAEEIIACNYSNDKMNIGFKSLFLIEILNNIDAQEVTIKLADASRAGLILPSENKADEEVLMLLMPMMLNDF